MANLLVLSSGFPQLGTNRYLCPFVKEFTDIISDQFENIYVISPQPYFPKILRKFKIFEKFYASSNFVDYSYNNVHVFFPTYYIIPFITRKINKKLALKTIIKTINGNKLKFDIIHCHFFWNGLRAKELKNMYKTKKVIVHCHDSILKNELREFHQKCIPIFKAIDASISFCEHFGVINKFLKENKLENKNIYIPNFVDTNRFYPKNDINELRQKYGFKINDRILICVGNIIFAHKGQNDILEIWNDLEKKYNNIHLILIGDGPDKNKMLTMIKSLKTDKIHYLGPKCNEEISDYLNLSDLFLFPSRYESFGIAPIEAIASGIPIISYKNGGTEYIIKDDKVGMVLDKQNSKLLEQGIIEMLNKKYDKAYLHKYIVDRYSGNIVKKKLLDLYKKPL